MIGAIIGDIAGSRFEWNNIKSKDFEFIDKHCKFTDDSVMTLAIALAIMDCQGDYGHLANRCVVRMRELGQAFPHAGYGGMFRKWLVAENPKPYNSYGNGSAMRVSACGFVARDVSEATRLATITASVTHNHPEGIKGAVATAVCIRLAREGRNLEEIREYVNANFYKLDRTLDQIRPGYVFDVTCQGSVPQAIEAFLESADYEDAIRNAISIGGDSDTIAAIAGGMAQAYWGVPGEIRQKACHFIPYGLVRILEDFEGMYMGSANKG